MSLEILLVNFLTKPLKWHFFTSLSIFLAKYLPIFLILTAIFFGFRILNWRHRLLFFSLSLSSLLLSWGLITNLLQYLFPRRSPSSVLETIEALLNSSSTSFPSVYAVILSTISASIFIFNRRFGILFFSFSFLSVLARVTAGVNWLSDILAGILIGSSIPFFIWYYFLIPPPSEEK